jgi:ornithine cyclodeaminase/alanine dehydrogenase-like protein (mu-crystallin family)
MALLIDNDVSARLLDMKDCVRVLTEAFMEEGRGEATGRNKSSIHVPTSRSNEWYRYASMEGASRALQVAAIRIKSDVVSWPVGKGGVREFKWTGRPGKFGGLILLFSTETGELLSILNDGWLQHLRVGATYAIGTRYQARDNSEVVGLLGTGGMARTYVEALALIRPVKHLQVYSPNKAHLESYADEMRDKFGLSVKTVDSPRAAMAGVDIVASMTDSMDPTVHDAMLSPGVHATTVTNWELDPQAYGRVDRMVTYRDGISEHHYTTSEDQRPHRVGGSFSETAKHESAVRRDHVHKLTDVMHGRAVGRATPDEITYFRAQGTGVQFAAVAAYTYERARAQGLGRELPSEWFLQDIRT